MREVLSKQGCRRHWAAAGITIAERQTRLDRLACSPTERQAGWTAWPAQFWRPPRTCDYGEARNLAVSTDPRWPLSVVTSNPDDRADGHARTMNFPSWRHQSVAC